MRILENRLLATKYLTIAVFIVFCAVNCSGQSRTKFEGSDSMSPTVSLTPTMLRVLRRAPDFSQCYESNQNRSAVTKVDVNGDGKSELLVWVGCGNSSTTNLFWLLARTKSGFRSIFNVGTQTIYFRHKRQLGFMNILALGCTANTCFYRYFSFNGQRYRQTRYKERPVP
jgi:hypothetical protein